MNQETTFWGKSTADLMTIEITIKEPLEIKPLDQREITREIKPLE
jgi:hypothetical protein